MKQFTVIPAPQQCVVKQAAGIAAIEGSAVQIARDLRAEKHLGFSVHRLSVADFVQRQSLCLPQAFTAAEGYCLAIEENEVWIGADTDAGCFYAYATLSQILSTAQATVPALCILDWPDLAMRAFNLCYHVISPNLPSLAPNFDFVMRTLEQAANMKLNAVVVEFETMFPFQNHPLLRTEISFTVEQMREMSRLCDACHIEVIPLVQSLGHAYYVLRHPEYAHLREVPRTTQQYCPTNPACREFYFSLCEEILQVFPHIRHWHMGGDESRRLAQCPDCAEKKRLGGMKALFGDHMNAVAAYFLAKGIQPMMWGDVFEENGDVLGYLDTRIWITYWNYDVIEWYRSFLMPNIQKAGYHVVGCPAAKFAMCSDSFYLYQKSMRNIGVMALESKRIGNEGMLITDWPKLSAYETSVISNAYGAQLMWSAFPSQEAFAARFATLYYGVEIPELDEICCMLSELSWGNMDSKDDIWIAPYSNFHDGQQIDGLDRFDQSRLDDNVRKIVAENVRQEISGRTVQTLHKAIERATRAKQLLRQYRANVTQNEDVYEVLQLAADTMLLKSRIGLAVDEAVKLLKYPVPEEQAQQCAAASAIDALLEEWHALALTTGRVLRRSSFAPSVEKNLASRFPAMMEALLKNFSRCLKNHEQLYGLFTYDNY